MTECTQHRFTRVLLKDGRKFTVCPACMATIGDAAKALTPDELTALVAFMVELLKRPKKAPKRKVTRGYFDPDKDDSA